MMPAHVFGALGWAKGDTCLKGSAERGRTHLETDVILGRSSSRDGEIHSASVYCFRLQLVSRKQKFMGKIKMLKLRTKLCLFRAYSILLGHLNS